MGNIKGSFIKQQIQNLTQIKQQSQTQEISKTQEPSIGQTEFQARKARFEQEAPKESNLSEETVKHLESRLEQVTSQDLSNKSSLLRPSSLTKQLEQEQSETDTQEEVQVSLVKPMLHQEAESQEIEGSADEADQTTNVRSQVSPPVTQVNPNHVEDLDELDENESENIADNANSTHKPLMPSHPDVDETESIEEHEDESNQVNTVSPKVNESESQEQEFENIADNANSTAKPKPVMPPHPHVNESEENEQEHDENNQVNTKPSIVPGSEIDESEGQTSPVNRPTHANQLPVNHLETESNEVEEQGIADNANSTMPTRRRNSDET